MEQYLFRADSIIGFYFDAIQRGVAIDDELRVSADATADDASPSLAVVISASHGHFSII